MSSAGTLIAEAEALTAPRFFGLLAPRRSDLLLAATKYHTAGMALKTESRWVEATNCFRQAATCSRMCGDSHRLFYATEQMIRMLIANGQYAEAHSMIMGDLLSVGAGGILERMNIPLRMVIELTALFEAHHPALALSLYEQCTQMCALRGLTGFKNICLSARATLKARQGSYGEAADLYEQCFREGRGTPSASGPSLTFHLRQHAGTAVLLHLLHSGNVAFAQTKAAEFLAIDYSLPDDRCWTLATRVLRAVEAMSAEAFTTAARHYAVVAMEPWFKTVLLRIKALITGIGEVAEL